LKTAERSFSPQSDGRETRQGARASSRGVRFSAAL